MRVTLSFNTSCHLVRQHRLQQGLPRQLSSLPLEQRHYSGGRGETFVTRATGLRYFQFRNHNHKANHHHHQWNSISTTSSNNNKRWLHTCTFAITRTVPNSFVNSLSKYYSNNTTTGGKDNEPISISLAKSHHSDYVSVLRTKVPTIELPPLEDHPDCVFVEDTVVAVGTRAVITNPGHTSRRGEVDSIKLILEQLGMEVWDMRYMAKSNSHRHGSDDDGADGALCDGGDVLNTGRHMFVGLSDRTNEGGFAVLQEAFASDDQLPVVPVQLDTRYYDALHLKSITTHIDENTLLAPTGMVGDKLLKEMKAQELGYQVVRLPDMHACNVVALNGMILASRSICDESRNRLQQAVQEQRGLQLCFVDTSEIAKSDGAVTCCSVLLNL